MSQHCEYRVNSASSVNCKKACCEIRSCGIVNNTLRDRHLLRTDKLTLSKAFQICQAAEMSKKESIDGVSAGVQVNAIQDGSSARGGRRARSRRGGGSGVRA